MDPYNNLLDFIRLVYPERKLTQMHIQMIELLDTYTKTIDPGHTHMLDTCKECPAPVKWGAQSPKKEENPMASYASATVLAAESTEKDQRRYITRRLEDIFYTKKFELKKQFGMVDDEAPSTPAEYVKRIADGKYTIDKERMDYETYSPASYIRWRDPSVVEDKAGYKAAREKIMAACQSAKDAAVLMPIADAKTEMDKFAAWQLS